MSSHEKIRVRLCTTCIRSVLLYASEICNMVSHFIAIWSQLQDLVMHEKISWDPSMWRKLSKVEFFKLIWLQRISSEDSKKLVLMEEDSKQVRIDSSNYCSHPERHFHNASVDLTRGIWTKFWNFERNPLFTSCKDPLRSG